MRLFNIITLLTFSVSFATFASQKQNFNDSKKSTVISFISSKKQVKINFGFSQANENLQNDFINNAFVKLSYLAIISVLFPSFLFLKNKSIKAGIVFKRIKFSYSYLLKILYPKHVFW